MTRRTGPIGTWLLAAASAAAVITHSAAMAQNAPQVVGIAASVIKDVKLSNAANPRARPVAARQRVAMADLVQTGKASQLQILLLDRSTFSVGANAAVRIDRFVYDPARSRSMGATVVRGAFRFMSGRSGTQNSATIDTPVATIGIRGTRLDGVVGDAARKIAREELRAARDARSDPKTATLVVLRGPGPQTDPRVQVGAASVTSGGVTVELTGPMQALFVPAAGAAPIGPFNISPGGLAQINDLVHPATAVSGGSGGLLGGLLVALPIVAGVVLSGSGGNGGNDRPGRDTQQSGTSPNSPNGAPR
jgi:hypothetical protein